MSQFCEICGEKVEPLHLYCTACGAQAPMKTIVGRFAEPEYENPVYCCGCGKAAAKGSAYCGWCGSDLYKKGGGASPFCPWCGEKVGVEAKICSSCGGSMEDWFAMKGAVAWELGFQGEFLLKEKMTGLTYHFRPGKGVTIGRAPDNDIAIVCAWVSSHHATIDGASGALEDLSSSNGTYINRSPDRISRVPLHEVREFNVGGNFTFTLEKGAGLFAFRLTAILDEEACIKNGDSACFEALRNRCTILLEGDQTLYIRKLDGYFTLTPDMTYDHYKIEVSEGCYHYTDEKRGIKGVLLKKSRDNWPVNWVVSSC
ncbi:FHA domain-containing protein [Desulfoluna sp.]|uniref:FHA domain-containing protein n=1 Tax=Desulfoluna sp. TaxID=2045199 RepID=UPI00261DB47C|nr:FHA domain-containing protein [Desulfoluna sp.]